MKWGAFILGLTLGYGYGAGGYLLHHDGSGFCWRSGCEKMETEKEIRRRG